MVKATTFIAMLMFTLIATTSRAQEFSADVVYFDANLKPQSDASAGASHPASKLYVSGDKIRLETNGLTGIVLLTDRHEHTTVALQPGKRAFEKLASGPSQYFRVENPDDACQTWQSIADQNVVCEKVGPETVNGRDTIKYDNKSVSETSVNTVWIDKSLKFVIKWQSGKVGAELRNINVGKLAADLFDIPSNYKLAGPLKGSSKGFSQK